MCFDGVSGARTHSQMYANALIKKAGVLAGHFEKAKCQQCFDKALAIDPDCIDVNIHRARVSLAGSHVACAWHDTPQTLS